MGRFSEQFIEQVAQATDIVDLVSGYVALKQKGREFVGLCPFHDDRNPSMYVSPSKQLFKCFVCGAGGGVYQWLMMYDKLPFPEAVEMLAERAGIPVPREKRQQAQAAPSGMRRADLLRVNTWAAKWFGQQLHKPAGKQALEYVRGRGLDDAALERFGVGYAPESFDALRTAARRAGINNDALLATGLIGEGSRGPYDRFRHRLMLPICDAQDRVIAFGGRALRSEERAKYLNSPESSLFDKSSNLYGLNWARQGIVQSGQAIVAEGYFDALIPLHMGVENVVATLGTALTDRHITLLARYAREVVLLFDADEAGSRAAQRALEMFLTQRFQVRVANVPAGKDPADYCLLEGPEAMRRVIEQAPDALSYMWSLCQQRLTDAGGNLADRRAVVDEFLRLVAESAAYGAIDEVRRSNVAQHIGHLLNIPPEELQRQMRRLARKSRAR
ncbi:MAG: DNA primase, partial [Planctomycetota bacterium]